MKLNPACLFTVAACAAALIGCGSLDATSTGSLTGGSGSSSDPSGLNNYSEGESQSPAPPDEVPEGSSGCSTDYSEEACVSSDAYDVDCDEVAMSDFESYGNDPYGLDRDGDGIACETYP